MSNRDVKIYKILKIEDGENSEKIIFGEIPTEALSFFHGEALDHFKAELELPGFRKGHVPEKMILERIGELSILEEAGERALKKSFPEIIRESKIDPVGEPRVEITKLSIGSPLEFRITFAVLPQFELPDYKKVAREENKKVDAVSVSEKEIDDAVLTVRKLKAEGEHDHSDPNHVHKEIAESELPELTDELVKTFGKFENIADFRKKLEESIRKEKELRGKEKTRLAIIENIIKETKITLPKVLVDGELDRMIARMKDDIERMGISLPEYLKRIQKTETDLRKEWEEEAEKRAKMELILAKIAEVEKIEATNEEIEDEIKHLLEHYKEADPIRAASYFKYIITNEKVFNFLESVK